MATAVVDEAKELRALLLEVLQGQVDTYSPALVRFDVSPGTLTKILDALQR